VSSGILVRPTIWPQHTNVTDTQTDRQQSDRGLTVCGRLSVVRLMLSDRRPVLSVMLVYCGQTVGGIKMKLGVWVGQGPGHIVLDGDPATPPQKGHSPQLSAHICCRKMAGWIKMSLGREACLGPSDIVLDGNPSPTPQKGGTAPNFRSMSIVAKRLDGSACQLVRR